MLPLFYQTHLQINLNSGEYLLLQILIHLLQSIKKVILDEFLPLDYPSGSATGGNQGLYRTQKTLARRADFWLVYGMSAISSRL
jgi:hypothetical protein